VSSLKPRKFHEWLVRVYYNPKGLKSLVQQKTEDDERKNQEIEQKNQEIERKNQEIERKNREIQQKAVDFFHEWCKNKDFIDSGNLNCATLSMYLYLY